MGRQQATKAYYCSVKEVLRIKAFYSNLRGLDARALAKESGELDFSAWNSS